MNAILNGEWHGAFPAYKADKPHRLTLGLDFPDNSQPTASLLLNRATPAPKTGGTVFQFQVQLEVNRDGAFFALLAKDISILDMLITMVLKSEDEGNALRGTLVFNNLRSNAVDQGPVEFVRVNPTS